MTSSSALDAVRDLRTSYFYSGDPGVFLFGGLESDGTLWDFLFQDFWNVDVNCNGQEGDVIVGLNQKLLPDDLEFAFITSYDDGVVSSFSSDAMTAFFDPTHRERFFVDGVFHTSLNNELGLTLQGMDEPDGVTTAHSLTAGQTTMGFTGQGIDAPIPNLDVDVYALDIPAPSIATLDTLWFGGDLQAEWRAADGTVLGDALAPDGLLLQPGTAYLALTTTPTGVITNHLFTASLAPAPATCPEDLNLDGLISTADILIALAEFGCDPDTVPTGCSADVDADGIVGVSDILAILSYFGLPANPQQITSWSKSGHPRGRPFCVHQIVRPAAQSQ